MGAELKRLLDIAGPRGPGDEIHASAAFPYHAGAPRPNHPRSCRPPDRHAGPRYGYPASCSMWWDVPAPTASSASRSRQSRRKPRSRWSGRGRPRGRDRTVEGRPLVPGDRRELRVGRHLDLRRKVLAGKIVGHRMGHAGKVGKHARPWRRPPSPSRRTDRPGPTGDRFGPLGHQVAGMVLSRFSTVDAISGDATSRFRERRMLVRNWVRASDMVRPPSGRWRKKPSRRHRRRLGLPLGPKLMERPALRRRHVAPVGPAAGQRQGAERALAAAQAARARPWRSRRRIGTARAAWRTTPRAAARCGRPAASGGVSNSRSRQWRIIFGSGIFTGQTLSHLPQKVEALGRCPRLVDADQAGVSTAPIGPG